MSLEALLEDPFGPYRDSVVLTDKAKSTRRGTIAIDDLYLTWVGQEIGLDESEAHPESHQARFVGQSIRFSGVVEIKHPAWLTPDGQHRIQHDIRSRDEYKRAQPGYHPIPNLTLNRLFSSKGDVPNLKIRVEGKRLMPVGYLTSNLLPTGMLFTSKDRDRQYHVKSLHPTTLNLSRNFLARYHLLALMQDIIDTDGEHTHRDEHTADYFIDGYMDRYAHDTTHRLHLVHIHEVESQAVHPADAPPALTRLQVEGIFAGQCEWILAEQFSEPASKRIISVQPWKSFCERVRKHRREARRRGLTWGLPYGDAVEEDFEDNIDFSRYRIVGKPDIHSRMRAAPKKKKKRQPARQLSNNGPFSDHSSHEMDVEEQLKPSYDSDFSVPSTPSASDSESAPEDVDPEILKLIPRSFWFQPDPPDSGFKWRCPVQACHHVLDMLNLTPFDTRGLPSGETRFLHDKRWHSIRDERVLHNFHLMVSRHYEHHLARSGIKLSYKNNKVLPQWIRPKQHRAWPPPSLA